MIDFGADPICPECQQGKHGNCDGTAWDHLLDERAPCQCERCECTPVNFVPHVEPEDTVSPGDLLDLITGHDKTKVVAQ